MMLKEAITMMRKEAIHDAQRSMLKEAISMLTEDQSRGLGA